MDWEKSEVIRRLKNQPGTVYQESPAADRKLFRDWLHGLLNQNQVSITFVKADGSLRTMRCTLDQQQIPENKLPKGHRSSATSDQEPSSLAVFDLDLGEWRSFKYERIKEILISLSPNSTQPV